MSSAVPAAVTTAATAPDPSSRRSTRGFAGDELADAAFRERDGQAAFAAIVRALHQAALDQAQERGVQRLRDFEIATRRRTVLLAVDTCNTRCRRGRNRVGHVHRFAEQDDGVAFVLEPLRGDVLGLVDEADDGNRGRRINGAGGALIVERAIAAGDGRVESFATFRQAAHGFLFARTIPA